MNNNHNLITNFGKAVFIGIHQIWDDLFEEIILKKDKEFKKTMEKWFLLNLEELKIPPIVYQEELFKEFVKFNKKLCFSWTKNWVNKLIEFKKEKEAMDFLSSCCVSLIGLNEKSIPLGNTEDVYSLLEQNKINENELLLSTFFFEANHRLRKTILQNKNISSKLTILPEWFDQTEWGHPQQLSFRSAISLLIRCQDLEWWKTNYGEKTRAEKVIEWAKESISEVKKTPIWEKNTRWHDFEVLINLFQEDWNDFIGNKIIERKVEKAFKKSL